MRVLTGHLGDLERNDLALVPALPNFDHLGGALGIISLPHDALKSV